MARPGKPIRPPIEEQLTIAPLPWSRIWRSSYFMQFQTPRRLTACTRSYSAPLASAISMAGDWLDQLLLVIPRVDAPVVLPRYAMRSDFVTFGTARR